MIRLGTSLRVLISVLLVVVLPLTLAYFGVSQARWRMQVVVLKASGKLAALQWHDLLPMLKPGSTVWLEPLVDSPNPYAVIANPFATAHDVKTGKALFRENCSICHGVGAGGGTGPSLVGRNFLHGSSDWALFQTVRNGVEGTPMPPHDFPSDEVWRLVAYVKNLNATSDAAANATNRGPLAIPFDKLREARAASADWPTYYGSYNGYRYSNLERIDRRNISQLQARWIYQLPSKGALIEATPTVVDGRMFITDSTSGVLALDAATGAVLWRFFRPPAGDDVHLCCVTANRGVALLDGNVYVATLDARLIALDGATGKVLWNQEIAEYKQGYSSTGAPLAVKGMVITGIAGSEYGANGFVAAFDAHTGKRLWTFDTIPKPGEKGNETWAGESWRTGGVGTWMTGTYDPELDLIFWGTANPAPDYDAAARKGDNLYANSIIALQADTGKLVWYFQATQSDDHDWDAVQAPVLADVTNDGQTQKVVLQGNRNGFFYALDRRTGKFLHATPFVKQNWAERIEANGRAVKRPEATPSARGALVFPGPTGATNWWPPTFSPSAQLFVVPALERPGVFFKTDVGERHQGQKRLGGSASGTGAMHYTAVRALDPRTGEMRWEYRSAERRDDGFISGLMSTAGGLVFSSDRSKLVALDVDNGRELWSFEAGGRISTPPSTFMAGGQQMVAFAAGDVIIGLALPPALAAVENKK